MTKYRYEVFIKVNGEETSHLVSDIDAEDAATEVMCAYETDEVELIRVEGPLTD